jgi:HD-like signal output (HDOD) protein
MHDIGKYALNILFPEKFGEALQKAASDRCRIAEAERDILHADHTHYGRKLSEYWNLGGDLATILGAHHGDISEADEMMRIEIALLKTADSIVREAEFGFPGDFQKGEFDDGSMELLGLDREKTGEITGRVKKRIEKAAELVNLF